MRWTDPHKNDSRMSATDVLVRTKAERAIRQLHECLNQGKLQPMDEARVVRADELLSEIIDLVEEK